MEKNYKTIIQFIKLICNINIMEKVVLCLEFSSLVLMEKDKEGKVFIRELGSYVVNEGAEYITKLYYNGEKVIAFFDTKVDVEDWEYNAIYDNIDEKVFSSKGFAIYDVDEEYNPTWRVEFEYIEEHEAMAQKINLLCNLISDEMKRVASAVKDKKEDYI